MKIFRSINLWFSRRVKVIQEEYLIDSLFIYSILDIFSWSFAFEEDKMMNLLNFLRREKSKGVSGGSAARVQTYTETQFDLVLGDYEAICLLQYVGLCGGEGQNQCLLLPFAEEISKRQWCNQLDQKALREHFRAQKKAPRRIRKRDVKDYRSLVRKQRTSTVCNVHIVNKMQPIVEEEEGRSESHIDMESDHVYAFSLSKTRQEDESDCDLFMKTQLVIDSINRLNYLSDSASDFSSYSRQSSVSKMSEEAGGGILDEVESFDGGSLCGDSSVEGFPI
jgi:hypothetical protein